MNDGSNVVSFADAAFKRDHPVMDEVLSEELAAIAAHRAEVERLLAERRRLVSEGLQLRVEIRALVAQRQTVVQSLKVSNAELSLVEKRALAASRRIMAAASLTNRRLWLLAVLATIPVLAMWVSPSQVGSALFIQLFLMTSIVALIARAIHQANSTNSSVIQQSEQLGQAIRTKTFSDAS